MGKAGVGLGALLTGAAAVGRGWKSGVWVVGKGSRLGNRELPVRELPAAGCVADTGVRAGKGDGAGAEVLENGETAPAEGVEVVKGDEAAEGAAVFVPKAGAGLLNGLGAGLWAAVFAVPKVEAAVRVKGEGAEAVPIVPVVPVAPVVPGVVRVNVLEGWADDADAELEGNVGLWCAAPVAEEAKLELKPGPVVCLVFWFGISKGEGGRVSVLGNVGAASFLVKGDSRGGKSGAAGRAGFSALVVSVFVWPDCSGGFGVKGEGFVMKHIPLHRVSALWPARRLAVFPGLRVSSYP